MEAATVKPTSKRYSPETWSKIRKGMESGVSALELAKAYGPIAQVIRNRSHAENWNTPRKRAIALRELEKRGESVPENLASPKKNSLDEVSDSVAVNLKLPGNLHDSPVNPDISALAALANASPMEIQAGIAKFAESLILQGLPGIEPPRNVKELATLNDIVRKNRGFDAKAGDGKQGLIVDPLRSVSRRPAARAVVEAVEVVDLGDPNADGWEV